MRIPAPSSRLVPGDGSELGSAYRDLTAYEAEQVRAIAVWKGQAPGALRCFVRGFAKPWVHLVHDLLPAAAVRGTLTAVGASAGRLARESAMPLGSEAASIAERTAWPLERCDALADQVIAESGRLAAGTGIGLGLTGVVAWVGAAPALLLGALRAVHRVGHCYGYTLDGPEDAERVLSILVMSAAATPRERLLAMQGLGRLLEAELVHEALEDYARGTVERALFGESLATLLPGFGVAVNAFLHRSFVIRGATAAKRAMQERYLRDRGKLYRIDPV